MNIEPVFGESTRYIEFLMNCIGGGGVFVGVGNIIQSGVNVGSTAASWGYMSTGQL